MNFLKFLFSASWLGSIALASGQLVVVQPVQAQKTPNVSIEVDRQSGTCPDTVGLWILPLSVVGAVEYTVVPNILPFTDSSKLSGFDRKAANYEATLNSQYASCVGQAESRSAKKFDRFTFRFEGGKLYFRAELIPDDINSDFPTYTRITYASVVTKRPYLIWRESEQQP